MNKRRKTQLMDRWWGYLLIAVIIIFIWAGIFGRLAQPKPTERLSITLVTGPLDTEKLHTQLEAILPELTGQSIREIVIDRIVFESDYELSMALSVKCLESDIVIVSKSLFLTEMGQTYFAPLEQQKAQSCFGQLPQYVEDGLLYGLRVYSPNSGSNFSRFYDSVEDCYLFFGPRSENTGGLNGLGSEANNAALCLAQWLMQGIGEE